MSKTSKPLPSIVRLTAFDGCALSMIGHTTTLVLGAGASAPYGLPVGETLQDEIISGLREHGELWKRLGGAGVPPGDLEDFRDRLSEARAESIDSFIRSNPHFDLIARLAIAARIGVAENAEKLNSPKKKEDWYELLWHLMTRAGDFRENQLRIITFNYDRSFEYYFGRALPAFYGSGQQADALLKGILPIHVHGEIEGDYQGIAPSQDALQEAARNLKLLPPNRQQPGRHYERARHMLSESDVICFLGFAYHKDSLERLIPSGLLRDTVKIFGTTYQMSGADREVAKERLSQITAASATVIPTPHMGAVSEHAKIFLENNRVL